jgi:hypothetical protein
LLPRLAPGCSVISSDTQETCAGYSQSWKHFVGQGRQTGITARQFKEITRIAALDYDCLAEKRHGYCHLSYDMKPKEHVDETESKGSVH